MNIERIEHIEQKMLNSAKFQKGISEDNLKCIKALVHIAVLRVKNQNKINGFIWITN